ncbi:ATP-binding protein [Paraglaciecola mesophila]|uniref:histidine kinase n=2 Tax=Paraglaciecola mesophila TaxID=197222 RepID=K6YW90_9ALTE|nr:ATP-binding protein [Paraglaciecola mesophila]GAC22432.1 two-component system, OmpR family, sensor histidine kinase CpxA [Paraglaciecola mesophila KMM 241]|tara:strand:- start:10197 stop:11600 length:1404 start_codon:yes stop_codon:yes gene_type:complete
MRRLLYLNPFRSLYGRIFLWFWGTTIVMIVGAYWIMQNIAPPVEYLPMDDKQHFMLENSVRALQRQVFRSPDDEPLESILERTSQRGKLMMILLNPKTKEFLLKGPLPHLPNEKPFLDLIGSANPLRIATPIGDMFGPMATNIAGTEYLLFVGRIRPRGFVGDMRHRPPLLLIGLVLLISAVLCSLIAWSLVKPLKQLQVATKRMASGALSSRVGSASYRGDEIGRLGRDFNYMAEQVETLLNGQKRLLADISHELRSPLTRMQLAIGIAQQQQLSSNPKSNEQALARIEKEAHQMEHMVAQVLMLSRLDNNARDSRKQPVSFDALLTGLLADCEFEAQSQDKVLTVDIESDAKINADEDLLASGIENVLRNAVKYANQQVSFTLKIDGPEAHLVICDDGKGIPESDLKHIFQPFYRVSTARERDSGGIGLGLAIASRAIAAHEGEIEACNQVKGGLSVHIRLPILA